MIKEQRYVLSIIIPHYNSPCLLDNLLRTIHNHQEIQVIVVDDNSNLQLDEYESLKKSYKNVLFLKNTNQSKGAGSARNVGLEHVQGKWLMFADADDFFLPKFHEVIAEYYDSPSDIIWFVPTSIEPDTGNISYRHSPYESLIREYILNPTSIHANRLRYKWAPPWSKMIKSDMVRDNNIKFSETMVSNDVMFAVQIGSLAEMIEVSEDIIYCVTKSKGSLTTSVNNEIWMTRVDMEIERYNFLRNVLEEDEIEELQFELKDYLLLCLYYKLGIKACIEIYRKFQKNNMKILRKDNFKFKKIIEEMSKFFRIRKISKRYMKH